MKKLIFIGAILLLLGLFSGLIYYVIDFNEYFLEFKYDERKAKCKYFDKDELTRQLNEYGFNADDIASMKSKENTFDVLFMQNDTSDKFLVLVHGKRECPYAMIRGGYKLFKMGYSVIIPVLYAHGNDSSNTYIDYGRYSVGQVNKCVDTALYLGAKRVGLIGRSMGASIAIIAAAKNKNIDAVVAECPLKSIESSIEYKHQLYNDIPEFPFLNLKYAITEWQIGENLDSLACIHFVQNISPRPLFLMAATNDQVVNPMDFEEIFEKAKEPKQIWREEINHTKFHSTLKDEFYIRVPEFFEKSFSKN